MGCPLQQSPHEKKNLGPRQFKCPYHQIENEDLSVHCSIRTTATVPWQCQCNCQRLMYVSEEGTSLCASDFDNAMTLVLINSFHEFILVKIYILCRFIPHKLEKIGINLFVWTFLCVSLHFFRNLSTNYFYVFVESFPDSEIRKWNIL